MPKPRRVLNGFTALEVEAITGLSKPMIDYLAREGYLTPYYGKERPPEKARVRGLVRYYSYRDLVVARVVQRLRECGLELKRLKSAICTLSEDRAWFPPGKRPFDLLATDGKEVYFYHQNGSLVELTKQRQQAFSFVVDVAKVQREVRGRIERVKRQAFAMENLPLRYKDPTQQRRSGVSRSRAG